MGTDDTIPTKFEQVKDFLTERSRRLWGAAEAQSLGYGGIAAVHRATGIVPSTLGKGIRELEARAAGEPQLETSRSRRAGGGRRAARERDPGLVPALMALVEPEARGDPMTSLQYTAKSVRNLADELAALGHKVGRNTVCNLLKSMDFRLNANRKMLEGSSHVDRDAQFKHINAQVHAHQVAGNPVISVDTKKKEIVGNFKNNGQEWCPKGQPVKVKDHDFVEDLGRASPFGVYDVLADDAWVAVGISADTAEFSVNAVRSWWQEMGQPRYGAPTSLLITADCGGSNGYRLRLWKKELQGLVDEMQVPITVCHLPPGTSKWNRIEHRLFSAISRNWRAMPLVDYQVIVSLIGSTRTRTGMTVRCRLDEREYLKGIKVTDEDMAAINLQPDAFHGEWNYTIAPRAPNSTSS